MDRPLLTIGAFARAAGLTPSALRHYDEVGLLRPAEVDEATGYRYYTPDLVERAAAVARMRAADAPIETMREVLDGTPQQRTDALAAMLAEATGRSERAARLVEELSARPAPADDAPVSLRIRGPVLADALRQVRPAAEKDSASPLRGVVLDLAEGVVDVAATNRYWMAVRSLPVDDPHRRGRVVLSLEDADRLAGDLDRRDEVSLELTGDALHAGGEVFRDRLVAYPAHRMVVAALTPITTRALLPRAAVIELISAAGRAEVLVAVRPTGVSCGEGQVDGVVVGPSLRLGFNASLLLRALQSVVGPTVELGLAAADRAVRIGSPAQPGFVALLMPIS